MEPRPTFPISVSNGILEPKHRRKIGSAIWLFLLLIDWTTDEQDGIGRVHGSRPIKVKELMEVLDLQERQIRDQLQRLNSGGYIRLKRSPYCYLIAVLKSKKWSNRDRQKTAALPFPDRQEVAALNVETGNNPPDRPAENCRCNILDTTVDNTNKSARRKKRERADIDPRLKTLMTAFAEKFQVTTGTAYVVVHGKDQSLLKGLLSGGQDVPAIVGAMDRYFANDFYRRETGFDIGGFAKAFNRLNSAGTKKRHNYEDGAFPAYE
jgi:hypothetical protein